MSGAEVIAAVRQRGVRSPIVVLTGSDESELADRLMTSGATDCLAKGQIDGARLARRFRSAVRIAEAEASAATASDLLGVERRLLASIVEQMPAGLVAARFPDGEILIKNAQVEEILGGELSVDAQGAVARDASGAPIAPADWPLARALNNGEYVLDSEISLEREGEGSRVISANAAPVEANDERVAAVMILHDVSEEHRAKAAAERAARARKEMLAVVSHDLRGPLNAIGIAAEELRDGSLTDAERDRYAAAIARAVARATRLITDLLDAEQADEQTLSVEPRPVSASSLLERARAGREVAAEDTGVELRVEEGAGDVRVLADLQRVQQVFDNLIGDALKHTRRGGSIVLSATAEAPIIRFSVADTGKGIAADVIEHVFDRFYQARSGRRGSAGLGLSIARGIVRAHGGDIGVESVEGEGATFWFTLPLATE